nr:hypothetical protein [Tanacetum cinerariifolium]
MEGHTKHFTSLRELLHMVEKNDLRRLSLDDKDAHDFWRNQDKDPDLSFQQVPAVPPAHATCSVPADTEPTIDATTPSSSRTHRKHLAKKRVTSIVDIADATLIKFDSASDSDDDPLLYAPYAPYAG